MQYDPYVFKSCKKSINSNLYVTLLGGDQQFFKVQSTGILGIKLSETSPPAHAEPNFTSIIEATSTSTLSRLFSILSKPDNMKVFLAAKDGVESHLFTPRRLRLSPKQYYKSLKQLKDAGLIQKLEGAYFHTSFGKILYHKSILGLAQYTKFSDGLQILDAIKSTSKDQFSSNIEDRFMSFIERLTNTGNNRVNTGVNSTAPTGASKKIELVWTYEEMISLLQQCIDLCENEIFIATRISPEIIIKTIQQKSKVGVKVRVLVDEELIKEYFKLQQTDKLDTNNQDKNTVERITVVSNPWYPEEKNIERRVYKVPFGMVIIDGKEVMIELVDRGDPHKFNAGILIRDGDTCTSMKQYYQRIWDNAYSNSVHLNDQLIDKLKMGYDNAEKIHSRIA